METLHPSPRTDEEVTLELYSSVNLEGSRFDLSSLLAPRSVRISNLVCEPQVREDRPSAVEVKRDIGSAPQDRVGATFEALSVDHRCAARE